MNFFRRITEGIKEKTADLQDKKEFLQMVEDEAKPIRRAAYLEQKKLDAIEEGKQIALKEKENKMRKNQPRKKAEDYNIKIGVEDPLKYFNKPKR